MLTPEQVLALMPQRAPFRFLDRILELDPRHAVGEYTFRADEWFYRGHFPDDPVTPGVILLETMCQTALVAHGIYLLGLERSGTELADIVTLFTSASVEFRRVVRPRECVRVESERLSWRFLALRASVRLLASDGTLAAEGEVTGKGVARSRLANVEDSERRALTE